MRQPVFGRVFAMPSAATFSMAPVRDFICRWRGDVAKGVDPFARNSEAAEYTNDLDCATSARWHMEAGAFLELMAHDQQSFDFALFDPPYSPRQISECYRGVGLQVGQKETQSAALYKRVRDALDFVMEPGGVVLSFGWHSNGMGKGRGYLLEEVLIVAHGAAHNDTICIAERKAVSPDSATPCDGVIAGATPNHSRKIV